MRHNDDSIEIEPLIKSISEWAENREDILALAIVGSHARNAARPDSDIDFMVLCQDIDALVVEQDWTGLFGQIRQIGTEHYGPVHSVRVFYKNGLEVEFGVANVSWAKIPLDSGTRRVIEDGIRILYDPGDLLERARKAAAQ